jgi:hypothetical protein
MPLGRHVWNLEGSWEDSVRIDELSEEWRSRQDVARIDGSDSDDLPEGSLPAFSMVQMLTDPRSRVKRTLG